MELKLEDLKKELAVRLQWANRAFDAYQQALGQVSMIKELIKRAEEPKEKKKRR